MTKKYLMTATVTSELYAVVETPDDWTEDDVWNYYRHNGSSGEFKEYPFGMSWEWVSAQPVADSEDPVDITLTEEDRV